LDISGVILKLTTYQAEIFLNTLTQNKWVARWDIRYVKVFD